MDAHILTIAGTTLVILLAMLASVAYLRSEIKGLLGNVRKELRGDFEEDIGQGTGPDGETLSLRDGIRRVDDRLCLLTAVVQHHLGDPPAGRSAADRTPPPGAKKSRPPVL